MNKIVFLEHFGFDNDCKILAFSMRMILIPLSIIIQNCPVFLQTKTDLMLQNQSFPTMILPFCSKFGAWTMSIS